MIEKPSPVYVPDFAQPVPIGVPGLGFPDLVRRTIEVLRTTTMKQIRGDFGGPDAGCAIGAAGRGMDVNPLILHCNLARVSYGPTMSLGGWIVYLNDCTRLTFPQIADEVEAWARQNHPEWGI